MILAATGHRPHHLEGGYSAQTAQRLTALATDTLDQMRPDHVRLGMAQGWDQAVARACVSLGIPWTAVLPGLGGVDQCRFWPQRAQDEYYRLLALATHVEQLSFPGAGREFAYRDMALVAEPTDTLLALWDGSASGTSMTVRMARERGLVIWNVWKEWLSRGTV